MGRAWLLSTTLIALWSYWALQRRGHFRSPCRQDHLISAQETFTRRQQVRTGAHRGGGPPGERPLRGRAGDGATWAEVPSLRPVRLRGPAPPGAGAGGADLGLTLPWGCRTPRSRCPRGLPPGPLSAEGVTDATGPALRHWAAAGAGGQRADAHRATAVPSRGGARSPRRRAGTRPGRVFRGSHPPPPFVEYTLLWNRSCGTRKTAWCWLFYRYVIYFGNSYS